MNYNAWLESALTSAADFPLRADVQPGPALFVDDSPEPAISFDPLRDFLELPSEPLPVGEPSESAVYELPPVTPLTGDEMEICRGAIAEAGLDVLAFYKSPRFRARPPFPGRWGIFIFAEGHRFLAGEFEDAGVGSARDSGLMAQFLLHRHERFHFRLDMWALIEEHVRRARTYETYRRLAASLATSFLGVEETLANRHALDSLRSLEVVRKNNAFAWLRSWVSHGPGGYGNIGANRDFLRAELAAQVLDLSVGGDGLPSARTQQHRYDTIGPSVASGRTQTRGDWKCPNYLIPGGPGFFSILRRIFPPLQLPRLKEIERFAFGYLAGSLARRSDHRFVEIDNGSTIKIPNPHGNKQLRRSEWKNILGKAGMRRTEWFRELERTKRWQKHCPRPVVLPPLQGF